MDYEILKDDAWKSVTEKELHEFHEECIEADINTPEYQKADYERESGNVWEDTPDDFEEFKAQMIADGMLRAKEDGMIEVKKHKGRNDSCLSCRATKNLVDIGIRRSRSMNASIICLCRDCAKEIYWRLIEMEGEEES